MSQQERSKILVLRFSALGDVALTIPLIWSLKQQHPNVELTFVSKRFAKCVVESVEDVSFFEIETNGKHKGFWGLVKLFRELKRIDQWDGVADLHDVMRTKVLRTLFWLWGYKVAHISKGRREKKLLTRRNKKHLFPLKHTVNRYAEVFAKLNLGVNVNFQSISTKPKILSNSILSITGDQKGVWIGVAPFAKHKGKAYPLESVKQVIDVLSRINHISILLFGAKGTEQEILEEIAKDYSNVSNLAGIMPIEKEIDVISNLRVMISMDSANMHLASMVGVPVISIWGATHPFVGFSGWNQLPENSIQIDLECRPCSVFGDKPCYRKDYACLHRINPNVIASRVVDLLNL